MLIANMIASVIWQNTSENKDFQVFLFYTVPSALKVVMSWWILAIEVYELQIIWNWILAN